MKRLLGALMIALAMAGTTLLADFKKVMLSVRPLQSYELTEGGVSGRNMCTVTSINESRHYWLTAAHCVLEEDGTNSENLGIDGYTATVAYVNPLADVAVVETPDHPAVRALRFSTRYPQVRDHVTVVGHPVGLSDVQVFEGYISSVRTDTENTGTAHDKPVYYMMFDMTVCGGNSGSAVVNDNDEVISVVQVGYGQGCSPFSGGATWQDMMTIRGYFGR